MAPHWESLPMNKNPISLPDLHYIKRTSIFDYNQPADYRFRFKMFCNLCASQGFILLITNGFVQVSAEDFWENEGDKQRRINTLCHKSWANWVKLTVIVQRWFDNSQNLDLLDFTILIDDICNSGDSTYCKLGCLQDMSEMDREQFLR